jgi:Glycosyltransferase family 87
MRVVKHFHILSLLNASKAVQRSWWRLLVLPFLLLISIAFYALLITVASPPERPVIPFLPVWMLGFLPYLVGSSYVLMTKPLTGRWFWVELSVILLGALIFRVMLLPLEPGSRDAWRYLWDARVIVHGYSPYVYAPGDKVLRPLWNILYQHARYRNVPTEYPPAAEAIYVISYFLDSQNLLGLKSIFIVLDMITCGALTWLLARRGLDPRRVLIYAWCPLPIVEFALEGHLDVIVVMFTVLAVLASTSHREGARALTGFFIALGTLSKFYTIFLLVGLIRRRDWRLLLTCFLTIILGYVPFLILGHGEAIGALFSSENLAGTNAGPVQLVLRWVSYGFHLNEANTLSLEHITSLFVISIISLTVLTLRQRAPISIEAATLVLVSTVLAISPHVFPWYTVGLLPWIAVLAGPLWSSKKPNGKGIAVAAVWYFNFAVLLSYIPSVALWNTTPIWLVYYASAYGVVLLGLAIASLVAWCQFTRLISQLQI